MDENLLAIGIAGMVIALLLFGARAFVGSRKRGVGKSQAKIQINSKKTLNPELQMRVQRLAVLLKEQETTLAGWITNAQQSPTLDADTFYAWQALFSLIKQGNAIQANRLLELLGPGSKANKSARPKTEGTYKPIGYESFIHKNIGELKSLLLEQILEMQLYGDEAKAGLLIKRQFLVYKTIKEFSDFLETREAALRDMESLVGTQASCDKQQGNNLESGMRTFPEMKICIQCGSVFLGRAPGFCLGCSAMNVEFEPYKPAAVAA